MIKLTQLYPMRLNIFNKSPEHFPLLTGDVVSSFIQRRSFAGKDEKPAEPAKEEQVTIKMPGFVHPENMKEEGYFTQKARKQLEELKRKGELPTFDSPDKKI